LKIAFVAFSSALALSLAFRPAAAFEGSFLGRNGLWRVVHNICAPVSKVTGLALPCLAVDRDKGFATVSAPGDDAHIVVTPLVRVSGVESPALLQPDASNYWADAWSQRGWVSKGAGRELAWSELGMAINSRPARTQDQLHIHVACVRPDVRRAADEAARQHGGKAGWFNIDLRPLRLERYRARLLKTEELDRNIFAMVASDIPRARDYMALQTIALIGYEDASFGRGFILLDNSYGAAAEGLLDPDCNMARG
jgi:CDP-diacylglycerol pyrophosphatase